MYVCLFNFYHTRATDTQFGFRASKDAHRERCKRAQAPSPLTLVTARMVVETWRTSLASQTSWRVAPVAMGVSAEVWLARTDVASDSTDDTRMETTSGARA